jgi:hypothetical protein
MVAFLLLLFGCAVVSGSDNRTVIPIGCAISDSFEWPSWLAATYYAMQLAIEEINNDTSILPNYKMEMICNTTWYSPSAAAAVSLWHLNRGAKVILGVPLSSEATPLSYVASASNLPIISYSASAPRLNNPDTFPSFNRLIASDTSQIGLLISLCRHFSWKNLVVVYTTDEYGRSFYEEIDIVKQEEIELFFFPVPWQINTGTNIPTNKSMEAYQRTGEAIKKLDVRVVFMMITSEPVYLLKAFSSVPGLVRGDYTFIMNQDAGLDYSDKDKEYKQMVLDYFGGIFSFKVPPQDNPASEKLKTIPFHESTGIFYSQNAYDSVQIFANAFGSLVKRQNDTTGSYMPENSDIVSEIRNQVFDGTSGRIRFCGSDRLPLEWNIYNMPLGSLKMEAVFHASKTDLKCPTSEEYSRYTMTAVQGKTPVFATGLTQVPIDRPYAKVVGLLPGTKAASFTLVMLAILVVILGFILIQIHAETRVIKGSSVLFCNLIFLGVLIAFIGIGIETLYDRSQAYACILVPSLLALSFDITFGSLFAKTWRLVKIFNNAEHLKRSTITNTQVFLPVFALILFDLLIVTFWAGLDLPQVAVELDPIRAYTIVQRCDMKFKTVWFALLIVPKLGVLIYGMQISYQVRNIDKRFRESKPIAVSLIALFLCGAITIPILLLVWQQIDAAQILLTIGVTLALISVVLVLFLPKFWRIYTQKEETELDKSTTLALSNSRSWVPDSRGKNSGGSSGGGSELTVLKQSRAEKGLETSGSGGGIAEEDSPKPTKSMQVHSRSEPDLTPQGGVQVAVLTKEGEVAVVG